MCCPHLPVSVSPLSLSLSLSFFLCVSFTLSSTCNHLHCFCMITGLSINLPMWACQKPKKKKENALMCCPNGRVRVIAVDVLKGHVRKTLFLYLYMSVWFLLCIQTGHSFIILYISQQYLFSTVSVWPFVDNRSHTISQAHKNCKNCVKNKVPLLRPVCPGPCVVVSCFPFG